MFADLIYAPLLSIFGQEVTLTPSGGSAATLTAIDRTRGIEVPDHASEMITVRPAAVLRRTDLDDAGIGLDDLRDAALVMGGVTWTVDYGLQLPTPYGATDGQVLLVLTGAP